MEKVLNRLEFIEEVSVSLTAEKINATVKTGSDDEIQSIIAAVDGAGFQAFTSVDKGVLYLDNGNHFKIME